VIDALRFEWTRIRTLRSTYWLIGLAVLLSAVVALIIAVATRNDPNRLGVVTVGDILTGGGSFALPFVPIFVAIIGVFATGHGYRHGTIHVRRARTAVPGSRPQSRTTAAPHRRPAACQCRATWPTAAIVPLPRQRVPSPAGTP
jgi:hypothetical protein